MSFSSLEYEILAFNTTASPQTAEFTLKVQNESTQNSYFSGHDVKQLVSNEIAFYVIIVVKIFMCGIISTFGIVSNTINMIVFLRQGVLSDSSSVSLFGLAFVDLLTTTSMFCSSISLAIGSVKQPDLLRYAYIEIYINLNILQSIFSLISRLVTAYIAFERSFCVVFPFKVRSVFSPKRTVVIVCFIFLYSVTSFCPAFLMNEFHRVTDKATNVTYTFLVQVPHIKIIQDLVSYINTFAINLSSVSIVFVCTVITVLRVNLSSTWRKSVSTSGNLKSMDSAHYPEIRNVPVAQQTQNPNKTKSDVTNTKMTDSKIDKEKKLVKMITLLCLISLGCNIPNVIFIVIYSLMSNSAYTGIVENLFFIIFDICHVFETVNSSVNIFLYYKMSSKFKKEFNSLFGFDQKA